MFLRLLKGFRYTPFPLLKFSTAKTQSTNDLLTSLFSLQSQPFPFKMQAKALTILNEIKPSLYELSKEDIMKLAVFTSNNGLHDSELIEFFAKNFKEMLKANSINLPEMTILLRILARKWTVEDASIISKYLESHIEDITPNTISILLPGLNSLESLTKSLNKKIEQKANEMIPYMNIDQLSKVSLAIAERIFASDEHFWQKIEKKILANFLFLTPKTLNDFCTLFFENSKGSEEFWKSSLEAIEMSADQYDNLKFFLPFLTKSKKGSSDLWAKYEQNFLKRLKNLDSSEMLNNIKLLTEGHKGSQKFWIQLNKNLFERVQKFDLYTCYMYVMTLAPFEGLYVTKQVWEILVQRVFKNFKELDKSSQTNLMMVLQRLDQESKEKKKQGKNKDGEEEDENDKNNGKLFEEESDETGEEEEEESGMEEKEELSDKERK